MLVFAYGSNMCTARLRARIDTAEAVTVGHVRGRRLAFHKRGADGSAKADAARTGNDGDLLWGVLFDIGGDVTKLDRFEPDYERREIDVVTNDAVHVAVLYEARPEAVDERLLPFDWYRDLVLAGAVEYGLPEEHVRWIGTVPVCNDPDRDRARRHAALLATPHFVPDTRRRPIE